MDPRPQSTIDISLDFSTDVPKFPDYDPDFYSPKLRRYHKLLWSKPLPSGAMFDLDDTKSKYKAYLYYRSTSGDEFYLGSDAVVQSFTRWGFAYENPELTKEENDQFFTLSYTIGGMMIFPNSQREGRKPTINQARGCHPRIRDRFDLTLECIRRHYQGETKSPLAETLARYHDFFSLFESFRGYVDFFLLQDHVTRDGAVKLSPSFNDFETDAEPKDLHTYREYRWRTMEFIEARNRRIERYATGHRLGV